MEKIGTKKTRVGRYALCLLLVIGLASCDTSGLKDAADNFAVVVKLEPINTNSTVLLTDAKTGELITKKVKATFSGPNGSDVIDMYSDPMSDKSVDSGVLNFGIRNAVTPTDGSPAKVQLTLEADGYETTTRTVSIDSVGDSKFSLAMANKSNPPQGITTKINTVGQAGSDGTVQSDFNVTVNSDVNPNSGASLHVSSGAVLMDKDGNKLSGQLTTDMSYYDPAEADAIDSFPEELTTENGDKISTAGMFSLRVKDTKGHVATTTSSSAAKITPQSSAMATNGGATVTLTLPSGYVNPMTGQQVKDGDDLTVFVLGANGGLSKLTTKQVVTLNSGDLAIKVPAFSNEAQAFVIGASLTSANTCSANISITRNGYSGSISGRVYTTGLSAVVNIPSGKDNSSYKIDKIPNQDFSYTLYTSYGKVTGSHNFCNGGDLNISLNPPSSLIDATVDVTLMCQNPDEAVRVTDIPGASILYRKNNAASGTPWKQATNLQWEYNEDTQKLTGGSFDVSGVENGQDYTFKTTYQDNTYQKTITITGTTVTYSKTITDDICQ